MKNNIKVTLLAAVMDVLHYGHVNLLKKMNEESDLVIVVIHNDLSVYKIKGKIPVQNMEKRIFNLIVTGLVDKILITTSTDPSDRFLDVVNRFGSENITYIRGNDLVDDFPGKWFLDKHKIPIKFVEYTKEISSSKIKEELLNI